MSWDVPIERLRGLTLFVGTPMYGGQCSSAFALSIAQLAALCTQVGVRLNFYFHANDALVTKARNETVHRFMASGERNLLFVDADMGFDPRDALYLLGLQELHESFDVVAAPYPRKRIVWDNVLRAARDGLADAAPASLARYASPVSVSPAEASEFPIGEPLEVTQAGTGFMMIRRATFERFRAFHPGRSYTIDEEPGVPRAGFFETHIDDKAHAIARELRAYLAATPEASHADILAFLDDERSAAAYSGHYVSEDYAFCREAREAGLKVWLCPWMELNHTGSHTFTGRLVDLARIGAA